MFSLPLNSPAAFGAPDFFELLVAAFLVILAFLFRPVIEPLFQALARKTGWCMLLLAALPVVMRLALLPHHPVPTPDLYDEFGHLLVADTLGHFRLANPVHPFARFFETFFVLQEPTYSSIYPIGQGLMLALGRAISGVAWTGVLISTGALCALCYWMLRGWTTPGWALAGGCLAVMEFGPLSQWMNSYWGGSLPAAAGCLVYGALPRLRESGRARDGFLLGLGLAIHWLTRPYESIYLVASVVLFLLPGWFKPAALPRLRNAAFAAGLALLPALVVTLLHDRATTHQWTTMPEMLSQYQYGVPAALSFQAPLTPHRDLTPQQEMEYRSQLSFRASGPETLSNYLARLEYRIRFYRFFFLPPLYLALPAFLLALREWRFAWLAVTLLLFALGVNFFPAFQFHYVAAVTCLFVLASLAGLQQISRWAGGDAARILVFLCAAHFVFWYSLHLFDDSPISVAMRRYETWDAINHKNPERRIDVNRQLARVPGKLLVFVRYWPQHVFQNEWVYNEADIDHARVVLARDLGPAENEKLLEYYRDRAVLLLEPDATPPKLSRYVAEQPKPAGPPPLVTKTAQPSPPSRASQPTLRFEDVR